MLCRIIRYPCSEVIKHVLARKRDSWHRGFAEQGSIAVSEHVLIAHSLVWDTTTVESLLSNSACWHAASALSLLKGCRARACAQERQLASQIC